MHAHIFYSHTHLPTKPLGTHFQFLKFPTAILVQILVFQQTARQFHTLIFPPNFRTDILEFHPPATINPRSSLLLQTAHNQLVVFDSIFVVLQGIQHLHPYLPPGGFQGEPKRLRHHFPPFPTS